MKLRVSWGGGADRTWQVILKLDSGEFGEYQLLGLSNDTPGSASLVDGELRVRQPSAGNYGGIDVTVRGGPDTKLSLEIFPSENVEQRVVRTISLRGLRTESTTGLLDTEQNQFAVARAPGDSIAVEINRPHVVFDPGEPWSLDISPRQVPFDTRAARCSVRLVSARTGGPALQTRFWDITLDEYGDAEPLHWDWEVPNEEGVYDLIFELEPRRYQQAAFGGSKIQRRIQFVVLAREAPQGSDSRNEFRLTSTSEASQAVKWDRRINITGRNGLPAFIRNGNTEATETVQVGDLRLLNLAPGQWQSIPLAIRERGAPHRIEIDYQNQESLALGFSVLEADATEKVSVFGSDSGVFRKTGETISVSENGSTIRTHSFVFWPSTHQPALLIMNRGSDTAAAVGQIRVFSGPSRLEAVQQIRSGTRERLAFYEYPLFAENFGAELAYDSSTEQMLTDWLTFYQGADRLIQHLQVNGYRGSLLAVAADGSSLYPSKLLQPTPRFDSGIYFGSGQDPVRKDVLELLFRMFSRSGLELIPLVTLNGRLPNLDSSIGEPSGIGILLTDIAGRRPDNVSSVPRYNPLNHRVQQEVERIAFELVDRFGEHDSFQGVALSCQADTCTQLPGRRWGYELNLVNQFLGARHQPEIKDPEQLLTDRVQQLLLNDDREAWLDFRCREIARWYGDLERTIRSRNGRGRLYLTGPDLYRIGDLPSLLSPSLQWPVDLEGALRELGWDLNLLGQLEHTIVFRPARMAPLAPLADERNQINLENSPQARELYEGRRYPADLFVNRAPWARVSEDRPGATTDPPLLRWQPFAWSGSQARKHFAESLACFDSRLFVDGGWLLPFESESRNFFEAFSQLEDRAFELVPPKTAHSPLVIRQSRDGNSWQAYLVNASPWPVTTQLNLSSKFGESVRVFPQTARFTRDDSQEETAYQLEIGPYELVVLQDDNLAQSILGYDIFVPETEADSLRARLRRIQEQLIAASTPRPLNVLRNPEFNQVDDDDLGWRYDMRNPKSVAIAPDQTRDANWALRLQSQGPTVWVRSNEIPMPSTGRLSISVWLRTDQLQPQPPLRIAIEADTNEQDYYRFARVGGLAEGSESDAVDENWKQFVVHFDDLPLQAAETMRVGFDLMGPGEVWIDRVELNDRWFDANDTKALTQLLAAAAPLLRDPGSWNECRRLLDGYWLRFLEQGADQKQVDPNSKTAPEEAKSSAIEADTGFNPFSLRRSRRADKPRMLPFR